MRKIELDGKIAMLTEKQYNQLLRRFDVSAIRGRTIQLKCICLPDDLECKRCPLVVFDTTTAYGCMYVLDRLDILPCYASLGTEGITWNHNDDSEARAEISAIRDALLTLKRV